MLWWLLKVFIFTGRKISNFRNKKKIIKKRISEKRQKEERRLDLQKKPPSCCRIWINVNRSKFAGQFRLWARVPPSNRRRFRRGARLSSFAGNAPFCGSTVSTQKTHFPLYSHNFHRCLSYINIKLIKNKKTWTNKSIQHIYATKKTQIVNKNRRQMKIKQNFFIDKVTNCKRKISMNLNNVW